MKTYRPELAAGLALAIAAAVTLFGAARDGGGADVAEAAGTCQVPQTFTVTRVGSETARQRFLSGEWSAWAFYRLNNVEQPPVKLAVDATGVVFSQALQVAVPDPAGADLTWRYAFYGSPMLNANNPERSLLFDSGFPPTGPEQLTCTVAHTSHALAIPTPQTTITVLEDLNGDGVVVPFEDWSPAGTWKVTAISNVGETQTHEIDTTFGNAFASLDYLFSWRITVNRPPNWVQTFPKGASGYLQETGMTNPPERVFGVHRQGGGG